MELRTDSLPYNLFALNQRSVFGEHFAPHPVRAQMALDNVIKLMDYGHNKDVGTLLSLFDMTFALFHEHHVKVPTDRALKNKSEIPAHALDEIRKSWPRYEALLEDHRQLCSKASKALGLHLGIWCHEVPTPL